jgi:hypothetical protein
MKRLYDQISEAEKLLVLLDGGADVDNLFTSVLGCRECNDVHVGPAHEWEWRPQAWFLLRASIVR